MSTLVRDDLDYQRLRKKLIKQFEGKKEGKVYTDHLGVATIGYGFNIKDNVSLRNSVYTELGISVSSEVDVVNKLNKAINDFNVPNDDTELKKQLDKILADRKAAMADNDPAKASAATSFQLNDTQIDNIFDAGIIPFEDKVDVWLEGVEVDAGQRLALISMSWNGWVGYRREYDAVTKQYVIKYNSPTLRNAVRSGNRADAWYEIRYGFQIGQNAIVGTAKRHYIESQIFGLFSNPKNVDNTEAQRALDVYINHLDAIKTYESRWSTYTDRQGQTHSTFALANNDLSQAGIKDADGNFLKVADIGQIFKPIANYIYDKYTNVADKRAHDASVGVINFNAAMTGDVVVGYETSAPNPTDVDGTFIQPIYRWLYNTSPQNETNLPAGVTGINDLLVALDDKGYAMQGLYGGDVLIGGKNDDTLYGGYKDYKNHAGNDGNDVLIGGDGDDNLYGQGGNNMLRGGKGTDNYYLDQRGTNTILDGDGKGKIYIEQTNGQGDYVELAHTDGVDGKLTWIERQNPYVNTWWELGPNNSKPNDHRYVITRDTASGELWMSVFLFGSDTAELTIRDFHNGDFGISFDSPEHIRVGQVPTNTLPEKWKFAAPSNVAAPRIIDPLAVDLNGDGIVNTSTLLAGVNFDLDNNGFAEQAAWVAPEDGLLVVDKNNNGFIDGGAELFGTETTLKNGQKAHGGFEALAELDSNKDNQISSLDTAFNTLKIWQDKNHNGIAESTELLTLASQGIQSISLASSAISTQDFQGVAHTELGSFTKADSSSGIINALMFNSDTRLTVPVRNMQGNNIVIPADVALLPNAIGFGNSYSLREAIVLDTTGLLKQAVNTFVSATDTNSRKLAVDNILIIWTGQSATSAGSRGSFVNAKHLGVLETFWGQTLEAQLPSGTAQSVEDIYQKLSLSVYAQLAQQTVYKDLFSPLSFTQSGTQWHADFSSMASQLVNGVVTGSANALTKLADVAELVQGFNPYDINSLYQDFSAAITSATTALSATQRNSILSVVRNYNDSLDGTLSNDVLDGFAGNDVINGFDGNDSVSGGLGNDQLSAGNGDDSLSGGAGIDYLYGGDGNDTYNINLSDGSDLISDTSGNDVVQLGSGITESAVVLRRQGDDLSILISSNDAVTVQDFFADDDVNTANAIEKIRFNSGAEWDVARIKQEIVKGTNADDLIIGLSASDTISGGKGNDELNGNGGSDTYVFSSGDGIDVISDVSGINNIKFTQEIDSSTVALQRNGAALVVGYGNNDRITVNDMFDAATGRLLSNRSIDAIQFFNGQRWSAAEIQAKVSVIVGSAADDLLQGSMDADTLTGGLGNDYLVGGAGDDVYRYTKGDGDDVIDDEGGTDTIEFGAGISPKQININRDSHNNLSIEILDGGKISVANAFDPNSAAFRSGTIDVIKFVDGTTWDLTRIYQETLKIKGDAGNNLLQGASGNDTFVGRGGNDEVRGGAGDDLYQYAQGDGADLIVDSAGTDILDLDVNLNQITASIDANFNLLLTFNDGGSIKVANAFDASGNLTANSIEYIRFADGTWWGAAAIKASVSKSTGGSGNGGSDGVNIVGTSQNDVIAGSTGNDTFIGGLGNDFLTDAAGNDTYRYQLGDGLDVIADAGGQDVIELGNKISSSQYTVSRDNANNVAIMFADGGQILVKDAFLSNSITLSSNNVEQLKFSDGITSIIANYMLPAGVGLNISGVGLQIGTVNADTIRGSNAADTLVGGSGDDQLFAGQGQDLLIGGIGNDTYEYRGTGVATIDDAAGIDRLNFIAGDSATTLLCKKDLDLIVLAGDGSQAVVRNAFDANGEWSGNAIENILLSDGVVWDSAYIKAHAAPAGVTQIIGTDAIDTLNGTAANDFIVGLNGDDVINGGKGNDTLAGGLGNDVYQYALGDGIDVISDGAGSSRIQFSASILPSQVLVRADANNNMVLTLQDGGSITFNNQFISNATVQTISFASDGTSWDFVRMAEEAVKGTSGNDIIYTFYPGNLSRAGDGNDSVYGGSGGDTLHGDAGNDYLSSGTGTDYVYGDTGNDILVSSAGGAGFHELDGGLGDDIYRIERGAALTYIAEGLGYGGSGADGAGGVDTIELPMGIEEKDVKVRVKDVNNNNGVRSFIITLATGEVISIETMFQATNLTLYPTTTDTVRSIENLKFSNGVVWDANRLFKEATKGSVLNDTIVGFATDDVLRGGAGDDSIVDANGNDTLSGDAGNDVIRDDRGDDTYVFNRGDGSDQLFDSNGRDSLVFGQGITQADLLMTQQGDDIAIAIKNTSDQILVKNWFVKGSSFYNNGKIEYLKFANGDVLDFDPMSIPMSIQGDSGSNQLYGGFKNDTLLGGAGDDTLQGDSGSDILQGDTGNDYVVGGDGNDEYRFNLGDGNDIISDAGGNDKITFGSGITSDQVKVKRDNSGNFIFSIDSATSITITDVIADWNDLTAVRQDHLLEELRFANGDVWDSARIFAESLKGSSDADILLGAAGNDNLNGAAGNDTLRAGLGNDLLTGGLGNDYLDGGDGDDTYYYSTGDGDDGISDASGADTLEFGAGILPTDIKVARDEYNLSLTVKNTTHITVNNFFVGNDGNNGGAAQGIESIKFSNAVWGVSDIKSKFSLTGTASANTIYGYETNDQIDGAAGNDTLFGGGGNDTLIGGVGNDQLYGGFGDDVLQGGDGADQFYDYTGNNIYVGGKGNDWFAKSNGSETYKFSVGDGVDYISSNYSGDVKRFGVGQDKIQFSAEITPEKLYFSRSYSDLLISIIGTTDSIQVSNYFVAQVNNLNPANGQIVFDSNSTSWDYARAGAEANKLKTILDATYSSIKGVASANATISASFMQNGQRVELGSVVTAADGSYTLTFSSALSAPDTLAVKLIDPVSLAESSVVVMKTPDWIAPAQPTAVFDAAYKVLSGSAEAGSTVRITNKNTSEVFTTIANASNQYTYTFTSPLVNKETVEVVAIDASLNVSTVKTLTTPDKTPPATPSGKFESDGKTIKGIAEPGSTVTFKNSSGTALSTTATVTANATTGAYTAVLTTALLDYQLVNVYAKDAAANTSVTPLSIHAPDTTKPPVGNLVLDNTTYKTITGRSEPGSTITVKNKVTNEVLPGAVVNASGTFTVNLNVPLKNKELIEITATDISGNVSLPATLQAPDKTPPVIQSAAFDPTGKYINGTTEANSNIIVKNASDVQIGTIKADSSGNFKVTLGVALTHKETVKVYAQDDVLNTSPATSIQAPLLAAARAIHLNSVNEVSIDMQLNSLIQTMAAFSPSPAAESHKLVSVYDHQSIILASQS